MKKWDVNNQESEEINREKPHRNCSCYITFLRLSYFVPIKILITNFEAKLFFLI